MEGKLPSAGQRPCRLTLNGGLWKGCYTVGAEGVLVVGGR